MKKGCFFISVALCLLLAACGKPAGNTVLSGNIAGLGDDTLYLYGMWDAYDHVDTIFAEDGKFSCHLDIDTITPVYLLLENRVEYPLFLDKRNEIHVTGDAARLDFLRADGNVYNMEYAAFLDSIDSPGSPLPQDTVARRAEAFIRSNPSSYVSLYLLDRYFVQQDDPQPLRIKTLAGLLQGSLLDHPYTEQVNEMAADAAKTLEGRGVPYFVFSNASGKRVSRNADALKDKNLLICFWASWGDSVATRRNNALLKDIYKTYKGSKYLALLGISLDLDKGEWQAQVRRDTLEWEQVWASGGPGSELVKQFFVRQLPCNLLLSPDGKILSKGESGEELRSRIEEAVRNTKERERNKKR